MSLIMEFNKLKLEIQDKIAKITFINAEKLNPLDLETGKELSQVLDQLKNREDFRVLIITGSGKGFSAGGNVKGFLKTIEDGTASKYMDDLTKDLYGIALKLREFPKPVIAAVNGYAMGAGMNLALCCDFVIASEKALFAESFSKLGLIPGFLGTHLLINQLSWQKAAELAFFGEMISPQELEKLGLVNRVVQHEDLEKFTWEFAQKLAIGPTLAYTRTKQLFLQALKNDFRTHLEIERKVQIQSASTKDYEIGVRALIKKEKPEFIGK
ncbi:MAG: enoyl-CoA hydratase/isomerase family protein [Candidatus Lokiarchaeota archaeon]|nr:enoyl-CoA hydratase/isomerase family protein [Candidatus Lokiarchaeota archaeon]